MSITYSHFPKAPSCVLLVSDVRSIIRKGCELCRNYFPKQQPENTNEMVARPKDRLGREKAEAKKTPSSGEGAVHL
jgi:hypothetical protein